MLKPGHIADIKIKDLGDFKVYVRRHEEASKRYDLLVLEGSSGGYFGRGDTIKVPVSIITVSGEQAKVSPDIRTWPHKHVGAIFSNKFNTESAAFEIEYREAGKVKKIGSESLWVKNREGLRYAVSVASAYVAGKELEAADRIYNSKNATIEKFRLLERTIRANKPKAKSRIQVIGKKPLKLPKVEKNSVNRLQGYLGKVVLDTLITEDSLPPEPLRTHTGYEALVAYAISNWGVSRHTGLDYATWLIRGGNKTPCPVTGNEACNCEKSVDARHRAWLGVARDLQFSADGRYILEANTHSFIPPAWPLLYNQRLPTLPETQAISGAVSPTKGVKFIPFWQVSQRDIIAAQGAYADRTNRIAITYHLWYYDRTDNFNPLPVAPR